MEDSPTLSQMLATRRESFGGFMYPETCEKSPNQQRDTMLDTNHVDIKTPKGLSCTTPVSLPPEKFAYSSGTKSLGIRRRRRPIANAASPALGVKRRKIVASDAAESANTTDTCSTRAIVTPVRGLIKPKKCMSEGRARIFSGPPAAKNGTRTYVSRVGSIPSNLCGNQGGCVTVQNPDMNMFQDVNATPREVETLPMIGNGNGTGKPHSPEGIQETDSTSPIPDSGTDPSSKLNKVNEECTQEAQKGVLQSDGGMVAGDNGAIGFKTANNKTINISQKAMKFAEALVNHIETECLEPENSKQREFNSNNNSTRCSDAYNSNQAEETYDGLSSIDLDEISPCCNRSPSPVLLTKRTWKRQHAVEKNADAAITPPKSPTTQIETSHYCSMMSDGLDIALLAIDLADKFEDDNTETAGQKPDQPSVEVQDEENLPCNAEAGSVIDVSCSTGCRSSSLPVEELRDQVTCNVSTSSTFPITTRPKAEQTYLRQTKHSAKINLDKNNESVTVVQKNAADDGFSSDDDILIQFGDELDKAGLPGEVKSENDSSTLMEGGIESRDENNASNTVVESGRELTKKTSSYGDSGCVPANEIGSVDSAGEKTGAVSHISVSPSMAIGFVTASNKKVHISDKALAKAQRLIDDELNATHQPSSKPCPQSLTKAESISLRPKSLGNICTDSNSFWLLETPAQHNFSSSRTTANKHVTVNNAQTIVQGTCGNNAAEISSTNGTNVRPREQMPAAPQSFVGFKTASNKPVAVSEYALAKAKVLLSKDADDISENFEVAQPNLAVKSEPRKPEPHVEKLTNLFQDGASRTGKKRNKQFKPPGRLKFKSPLKPMKQPTDRANPEHGNQAATFPQQSVASVNEAPSSRRLLGIKNCGDSQISVSDESLVKAAEMLEDLLG